MKEIRIPDNLYNFLRSLYQDYYQRIKSNPIALENIEDAEIIAMIFVCAMQYHKLFMKEEQ